MIDLAGAAVPRESGDGREGGPTMNHQEARGTSLPNARLAAVLLVLASGCTAPPSPTAGPQSPEAVSEEMPQPTAAPAPAGPGADTRTYPGKVQARWWVEVTPRATGRIEQLFVDVGSSVAAGDPIAVLEH